MLAGCAEPGCHQALSAQLLFGLSRPSAPVSVAAFDAFLDASVTPRFPAGLTVLDAAGRWRSPGGQLTQEASKLVLIVTEPGADTLAGLQAIRSEYKQQFQQQSVGMVLSRSCADF